MAKSEVPRVAGIILAAGKGTRMLSAKPKVLHNLAGLSMLEWVFRVTKAAGVEEIGVILSEDFTGFEAFLAARPEIAVATQKNRQGTGDAAASAALVFKKAKRAPFMAGRYVQGPLLEATHVLIMAGDVPAIDPLSLKLFVESSLAASAPLSVLGMDVPSTKGYGRLVTQGDELLEIVEDKDADEVTRKLTICNTGVIFAEADLLFNLLAALTPNNAQKEYYLTDVVKHCRRRGLKARFHVASDYRTFAGINDRLQLAAVEKLIVRRKVDSLMLGGVTVRQPASCFVEADVEVGRDSELGAGVKLLGRTILGANCFVAANAVLTDVIAADGVVIGAGSVLINCRLESGQVVAPVTVKIGI